MSVQCGTCDQTIATPPQMPIHIFWQEGKQVIPADYSLVYEHMRDAHPDQWTDEMAEEFRQHKAEQKS